LENVIWRGRCETKVEGSLTWYIDGAHTADSIVVAAEWYGETCSSKPGFHVLIFNQQGHREALGLLEGLFRAISSQGLAKFDHVIFCTNAVQADSAIKRDFVNHAYDSDAVAGLTLQKSFATKWRLLDPSPSTTIKVLPSIEDAIDYARGLQRNGDGPVPRPDWQVHVLITGSVHLVGRALGALEGVDAL